MATSVRQNSMPPGGPAAQQPVPATLTPQDVAAIIEQIPQPAIVAFRSQSSPLSVALNSQSSTSPLGFTGDVRIASVGLGYRVLTEHVAVFTFANASGSTQNASFGLAFPWNLINRTQISINGGAQTYNADGYMGLLVAMRDRSGSRTKKTMFPTDHGGLPDSMVRITNVGANVTLGASQQATYSAGGTCPLIGYATIQVAASASTNNTITVTWYTYEKVAFSRDSLLGALPLQNNTTYATLTRTLVSSLTPTSNPTTASSFPFWNVNANITITWTSYSNRALYYFWSVPSNPQLYQEMIGNSYQVLETFNQTVSATGVGALDYLIPQNHYLTALHFVMTDSTGALVNPLSTFLADRLQYNAASVIPVYELEGIKQFAQFWDYQDPLTNLAGYLLWDGNATSDDVLNTDQAGWVDCYATATPDFQIDLASTLSTPASYNVTRESVVAGAVNVVGGQA